jgi:putative membrane protein
MTLKSTLTGIGFVFSFSIVALAQTKAASHADQAFLRMAAESDMTEAHIGQMAEAQASRSQVKDFAQKLTHDHTSAYEQLTALGAKTGGSVPAGIDARKIPAVVQLTKLKGTRFDHQFAQDEVRNHEKAIAAFKREAEHGQNADVKAYANKMIPTLEDHLHQAQALEKPAKHS